MFTEHTAWLDLIKFSPNGTTIAGMGRTEETIVRLWDAKTGKHKHSVKHKGSVTSVAFSPDSTTLATGSADTGIIEDYRTTYGTTLAVWDAKTGEHTHTLTGHTSRILSVAFSPDSSTLATGSGDMTVRLWDAKTSRHMQTLTGHTDWVNSVAFSRDGNTIATGSYDKTVRLWDANTEILKHMLTGHTDWVNSIAFSPDGNTIATGRDDGTVFLWDVPGTDDR